MDNYLSINLIYASASILLTVISLSLNASGAPGNWIMLVIVVAYASLISSDAPYGIGVIVIILVLVFAIFGEVLEFITGAISTRKAGGSKRGMWFSVFGSVVGSFAGIFIGVPIPIIGSLIAALLFSGAGALLGAYYGERVEGKSSREAWKIGISSFVGRVLGSIFKILCGLIALICMVIAMLL